MASSHQLCRPRLHRDRVLHVLAGAQERWVEPKQVARSYRGTPARREGPSDSVENAATEPRRRAQRHCGYGGARLASLSSRCRRETERLEGRSRDSPLQEARTVWELDLPHQVPARREDLRRRSATRVAGGVDESWWPVKVSPGLPAHPR